MNWGYRITLLYVGFITFILTLVVMAFQQDVNLVAKDYYKQEIAYQDEIDKMTNVVSQKAQLDFGFEKDLIVIQFPESVKDGKIVFFRPSTSDLDFEIPVLPNEDGKQFIPLESVQQGVWRLKINWKDGRQNYYTEERLLIHEDRTVNLATKDGKVVVNVNGVIRKTKDETKKSKSERKL